MAEPTKPKTILVTGFGPFGEHKINASWEAVSGLPNEINGLKIVKEQVPVAYEQVEKNIPALWQLYNPKLVVHVGVSALADKIQIESRAHRTGYEKIDIEKKCPAGGTASCAANSETDCIETGLCTKTICDRLNEFPTLQAATSDDPGRYLCEFIYYTSLSINSQSTLFVHVPPLDKPFSKKQLTYALEEIIKCGLVLTAKNEGKDMGVSPNSKIYKNGRVAAAF